MTLDQVIDATGIRQVDKRIWSIPGQLLKSALSETIFATGESTRYALGSVCFEFSKQLQVDVVATDGRQLAHRHLPVGSAEYQGRLLWPRKDAQRIWEGLGKAPRGNAEVYVDDIEFPTYCRVTWRQQRGTAKSHTFALGDGRYPKWQDVVPQVRHAETVLIGTAGELLEAMSAEINDYPVFNLEVNGCVHLSRRPLDLTRVLRVDGSDINIAMNPQLLVGWLRTQAESQPVAIRFSDERSVIRCDGSSVFVFMPCN